MADKLMASVLSCLPNTTYDLPAFNLLLGAYGNNQSNKSIAGRSYVVFGKQDNTNAIELSAIAAGTSAGGFVINGEQLNHLNRRH
jgi:hypothetical protein